MTSYRNRRIRRVSLALLVLSSACALLAEPAVAARPPVGRTYYTVAMGLEGPYGMRAECFEFYEEKLCSIDGVVCGVWQPTADFGPQMPFSFDLTTLDDGELMQLEGVGRLETQGQKSSVAGTGRFVPVDGGRGANFSFAAREVGRQECLDLLGESPLPDGDDTIIGSGVPATEERDVSDFHAVVASGVGRIEIRHGATESLRVTADDNLLPILRSEVRDGQLILEPTAPFQNHIDILWEVTVRDFDALTVSGVVGVDITGLQTDRFTLNLSGVSVVTAAGRVEHQELVISGLSRYDARELESRTASVDVTGPSRITVRVSDRIEGSIAGGATLEYIGSPAINVTADLLSSIRKIG